MFDGRGQLRIELDYCSPIEEVLSKAKGFLRRAEARSRAALVEAMGKALDAVIAQDAERFFEHCGNRASSQLF
jgi:hypothetical protein